MKKTRRREMKYLISYMDYYKIKPLLEQMLIHDVHGEEDSYPVHSIYFDDLEFNAASDKAFGNEFHKKYRIRYYNEIDQRKLEIKEKSGEDAVKSSTAISNQIFEAIMNQDIDLLYEHMDNPVISRFVLDYNLRHLLPKVMISYQREAYRDQSDNLRVTFDHTLCGELYLPGLLESDFKLLSSHLLILEVKYEHFLPKNIRTIISQIKPNQQAYSKYYFGYQRAFT